MGLIPDQPKLTSLDPAFEARRARTYPGMAHFAGTGPAGVTCRLCAHWTGCGVDTGHYSRTGVRGGVIKPRACAKYRAMMHGDIGPAIPHDAVACKYFDASATPPAMVAK